MASTNEAPSEERELALIDKVEMRIALSNDDKKLEKLLNTYLAPLLLKLNSPHLKVRNKIISVCQHINSRIEPPTIQLPVLALIDQLKKHPDSQLIRYFGQRYVSRGLSRLRSQEQREELLKSLIKDISQHICPPSLVGPVLFHFLLQILSDYQLPGRGDESGGKLRDVLEITDDDASALSSWFAKFLLFPSKIPQSVEDAHSSSTGISKAEAEFLFLPEVPESWNPNSPGGIQIAKTKGLVLDFVDSTAFTDPERLWVLLSAIPETNPSGIADRGNDYIKIASRVDLEDRSLVKRLYDLYVGSSHIVNTSNQIVSPPMSLRTRTLTLLGRSNASASYSDLVQRVIQDGLADESNNLAGSKFNSAMVNFIIHVLRLAKPGSLGSMTETLLSTLRLFIENQGWPKPTSGSDLKLRGKVYELIGLTAKEGHLVDFKLLEWILQSLNEDTSGKETLLSVEEAASSITQAFAAKGLDKDQEYALGSLLTDFMLDQTSEKATGPRHRSVPFVLARLANRCLPFGNVIARTIDILTMGSTDRTHEAAEEARRGLDPFWFRMLNPSRSDLWLKNSSNPSQTRASVVAEDFDFPDFSALCQKLFPSIEDSAGEGHSDNDIRHTLSKWTKRANSFAPMIKFCYRILINEATASTESPAIDENWERVVETSITSGKLTRVEVGSYLSRHDNRQTLSSAIQAVLVAGLQSFSMGKSPDVLDCQDLFVQLLSVCPEDVLQNFGVEYGYKELLRALSSSETYTRAHAARAFGILYSSSLSVESDVNSSIVALMSTARNWQSAVGSTADKVAGATIGLAYALSRMKYRGLLKSHALEAAKELHQIVSCVIMKSKDATLLDAAYTSVGQLGIWLVYGEYLEFPVQLDAASPSESGTTVLQLIEKISSSALSGNEKAIKALGCFSIWLEDKGDDLTHLKKIHDQLRGLHQLRQTEKHFTVGEALCCLACGWDSDHSVLLPELDIAADRPSGQPRKEILSDVMQQTLQDCRDSKPALRRAAVIWLLCLVQFCGGRPEFQGSYLIDCQSVFKRCLSDRDELVQEAAARGLGLVYDKCSDGQDDAFVEDLISSLSDSKPRLAGTVSEDTQLFEEGNLKTGDGSITTYKDILNLASELGDPRLVYKFMPLAASNAIWSSRAAIGKFGVNMLSSASKFDEYLSSNPKYYAALYRNCFDPVPKVQEQMKVIWKALVKDPNTTLDDHFDSIIESLLQTILGREWRTREASCRAMAELLQDRKFEKYEKYLGEVWGACSKVMDDIKGSVREAAQYLGRTLTGILIRTMESGERSAKSTSAMLEHVLPFLRSPSGVESKAKEVQAWAVSTLTQIIKKCNPKVLEPFVPGLIEWLIALFSALEPAVVNYLHLNASNYNLTTQDIDDVRLKVTVKGSPLMEAVERCLDIPYNNEETTQKVVKVIETAMKSALGMPSQVATSRIVVTLCIRHHMRFKDYMDRFLKGIEKCLLDRNETVSSSYAYAAGYLSRWATDEQVTKTAGFAWNLWRDSESDRQALVAAEVFHAISKHASERFSSLGETMLSYVFVGKHDDREDVKEIFKETWNESTSGPRVIILHLQAMMKLADLMLADPKWRLKHAAARSVAEATVVVSDMDKMVSPEYGHLIWSPLVKALDGKSWEGKEVVLDAFVRLVVDVRPFWEKQKLGADIKKIIVREAKRQNRTYQQHSFSALGKVAAARSDIDWNEIVMEIVSPAVEELAVLNDDAMEVDGQERVDIGTRNKILSGSIFAAQESLAVKNLQGKGDVPVVIRFLDLAIKANSVQSTNVTTSLFEALDNMFEKLASADKAAIQGKEDVFAEKVVSVLYQPQYDAFGSDLRLKRAKAIASLTKIPWQGAIQKVLKGRLENEISTERSPEVKDELTKARAVLN